MLLGSGAGCRGSGEGGEPWRRRSPSREHWLPDSGELQPESVVLSVRCESREARNTLLRDPSSDEREPDLARLYRLWRPTVSEVLEEDFFLLRLERPPAITRRTMRARLAASPAARELLGPVVVMLVPVKVLLLLLLLLLSRELICVVLVLRRWSRRESLCLLASLGERRGAAATLPGEAAVLAEVFSC